MKKKKTYVSPEAKYWSAEELNEIEAKMSGGSGGTATGSSFFPYQLTDGEAHTTNIRKYWFKCRTRGATDVSIVTSKPATIKIYKSKLFFDELIESVTNKKSLTLHLWDYKYKGLNSYRIYVSFPTGSGEVTCFVGCHTDVATYHEGALWIPKSDSARPLSKIEVKNKWYIDKTRVAYAYVMVSHQKWLDSQSALSNGLITTTQFLIQLACPQTSLAKAVASDMFVTSLLSPIDYKQVVLNKIDNAAGYIGISPQGMPIYSRGVSIQESDCTDEYGVFAVYDVEPWTPPKVYGPVGYAGNWPKNG